MSKKIGLSFNRWAGMGRVVGNPQAAGGWARAELVTLVPENTAQGWQDVEHKVPLLTNNPKTVETLTSFVQDERQLYVEGYVSSWKDGNGNVQCGVMITNIKLGAKTMYDPETDSGAATKGGGGGGGMPGFPPAH